MAKSEFMAALPGGLEALGGIATEIVAPGNPAGIGMIAGGLGSAIKGVNAYDDSQKAMQAPQIPMQTSQMNNNQFTPLNQQFTQMPTQTFGGNQPLGASQYYGIPTGGMPQYAGGIPTMSPQSLQYGQSQQFNKGGTVKMWNPYMTFANGGKVGYFMGSNGLPFQPNTSSLQDTSGQMFDNSNTTQANVFGNPDVGNLPSTTNNNSNSGFGGYAPYASAGLGLAELGLGLHGLNQLSKQAMPQYLASAQLNTAYNRANKMAEMGYTPEEIAAFHNNLSQSNNTVYQNAIQQGGGNLAGAINAGIQSQNIGALNNFAGQDAALKRSNMQYANSFAPQFQNIQDENTRTALQQRMMREQALGGAANAGLTNLTGALNLYQASQAGNTK